MPNPVQPNEPHVPTGKQLKWKPVAQLLLDPENPRLIIEGGASQEKLLKMLYEQEALDELAPSLARYGYFVEEPLIVVPDPDRDEQFVVVEGNRRLATVKLLLDPKLRRKIGVEDWPTPSAEIAEDLALLPTVVYSKRERVVPYLGFRHITGIKKWDYFQKARYISSLVDNGKALTDIESEIGDSASTVKRLYQIFVVHTQLERDLGLDTKRVRENFSLLEVALSQRPIKHFLGMPNRLPMERTVSIVDDKHIDHLRELISWIYGDSDKGEERVIHDSRQIQRALAPVLASEKALGQLRHTRDLEAAYEFSDGERTFLLRQLATADRAVERALGVAHDFETDEDVLTRFKTFKRRVNALEKQLGGQ